MDDSFDSAESLVACFTVCEMVVRPKRWIESINVMKKVATKSVVRTRRRASHFVSRTRNISTGIMLFDVIREL